MKYQCVIFDLDGTLLYTLDDLATSVNLALSEFGYPTHDNESVKTFVNNGAVMLIQRALPETARDIHTVKTVLTRYLELYKEHLNEKTYAYDGLIDLCKKLKQSGLLLGVVSNKPDYHTKELATLFFGKDTFSYLSGTGEGLPTKPDANCVLYALDSFGIAKESTLFVGDSHVDVKTARNAGVACAGVLWGFGGSASFIDDKPDYLVKNARELQTLILGE
jgi:haloacid dehalogenase superfamily, subfamily IA, variant 3 with third motif having DD or ED/haloacid dehalogenase superfamily, subfamily IA, variant 1 with third motif having Dx(3-4)D or Dx(3-4)E